MKENNENIELNEELKLAQEEQENVHLEVQKETEDDISLVLEEEKSDTPVAVSEEITFRGENMKVFNMNDGTKQAVFYNEPIHVYDEKTKEFVEIDDSLVEDEDGRHYRNKKNRFCARFSKEEDSDELFSIEKEGYKITLSTIKNTRLKSKRGAPGLKQKKKKLTFENIAEKADFEYEVTGDRVKENIIIKEKNAAYRYSFNVESDGLETYFSEKERKLSFTSAETGEEIFNIPAPFMVDANGEHSDNVFYEMEKNGDGRIILSMIADSEWINNNSRVFPVIIDPQVVVSGSSQLTTYSWYNGTMSSASTHTIGTTNNSNPDSNYHRIYMKLALPTLPRNPRIKKAELIINQKSGSCSRFPKIGLYKVTGTLTTGSVTPAYDANLLDYAAMKNVACTYTFDITSLADAVNKGETSNFNLMFKMLDEAAKYSETATWYGSADSTYSPKLAITYESSYGVNTSGRTHTHEAGRFGTGSIDLQSGNLMFESEDFSWSGNRMPVSIRHLYNSALSDYNYTSNTTTGLNTADFSGMSAGKGWKLNYIQSIISKTFTHEGTSYSGYIYTGESGEEIYLKKGSSTELKICYRLSNGQCCEYYLYEDVNGLGITYDNYENKLYMGGYTYLFDSSGRLVKITDEYSNSNTLTYTSGKLTSITDGAGRMFTLNYNASNLLEKITAPDSTAITYSYLNNCLSQINYPNGQIAKISCNSAESYRPSEILLTDTTGTNLYKIAYTYSNGRVNSIKEYGYSGTTAVLGQSSSYTYSAAARKTTVASIEQADGSEAANTIETVYTFDDDGNMTGSYIYSKDTGNTGSSGGGSGINPYGGDSGASVISNINNLLLSHSFDDLNNWTSASGNCSDFSKSSYSNQNAALFGSKVLSMQSNNILAAENGIYQVSNTLPAGKYTFSLYIRLLTDVTADVKITSPGAYIKVTDTNGNILAESEHISKASSDYIRLAAPFDLTASASVKLYICINGKTNIYADGAQLENNPYANPYNMLTNGNFERSISNGWCNTTGASIVTDTKFNMSSSLRILGEIESSRYICQPVAVKTYTDVRESFTLSGWAKGYAIPDKTREFLPDALFRLRAKITYSDNSTEDHLAGFSPCTEEWQLASVQFAKQNYKTIKDITVYCEYSYNVGYAYFDDIQLIRDNIESKLSSNDFYSQSEISGDVEISEYQSNSEDVFKEVKDSFGNALTETTFKDGDFGTIYRSFGYSTGNGNNLISETDSRGNTIAYTVDETTSRSKTITDRCGTKNEYTYDSSGRVTSVTVKNSGGTGISNASYTYDTFDNLIQINCGNGMKYAFAYNNYHSLESIGISGNSTPLVKYTYKNGNGRLKQLAYANGDTMNAVYNSIGQFISETWKNNNSQETARYKYVYDGSGNIVRSIDITNKKEYNYYYENGKITRSTESTITLNSSEIVNSKNLDNIIIYSYDSEGKLRNKRIQTSNGAENTYTYEHSDGENTVVKLPTGVISHSKTDHMGRKTFDELQLGTGFLSRQFSYLTGKTTDEHVKNSSLKSSPTTSLVQRITFANGRTIDYTYDAEDRITKAADSIDGTAEYTYDVLGQLTSETKNGVKKSFVYDNYGNITKSGENTYTYGDSVWKDKLTAYNGTAISYDAGGNPLTYRGYTFTWEKGRQLKTAVGNGNSLSYTYNANGIRTSKTVNGVKHEYTLEGTRILRETYGTTVLDYLYDNEDTICGLKYNGTPYYFYKNLQGDIISVINGNGAEVVKYTYDAWGTCTVVSDTSGVNIGKINPFRYREYYFDVEMGYYYLQSRYYDPIVGRFINADEPTIVYLNTKKVLSTNLFTYCLNSPVNFIDPFGYLECSQDANYNKFAFNNWETEVLMAALGFGTGALDIILAAFGFCTGTLLIAVGIGIIVSAVAGLGIAYINLMNKLSKNGSSGVTIYLARKWYKFNYISPNKVSPKGFNSIYELWNKVKPLCEKIVKKVGEKVFEKIIKITTTYYGIKASVLKLIKDIYNEYQHQKWLKSKSASYGYC